jgi:F-type H+-transporting ATPase subunit delta
MIEKTLAKRYATALLAVTHKEGKVEETEATMLAVRAAWERDARMRAVLTSPKIPKALKKDLLAKVLAGASASVREFFALLVQKNRIKLVPDVAEMYDRLADAFKGVVRVQVRSAVPLTDAQRQRVHADLERIAGSTCSVEHVVDRALKGGVQVRMGDTVIDGTVAHRLKTLRERLHELQKR